ncbi:MAG: AraC family transcriptional regulator [Lachnospiraceae bacterium]
MQVRVNKVEYSFKSPYLYRVNRCGDATSSPDFYINRNNSYQYYVFHLVKSGSGVLIIDGKEHVLKKNDLFIIKPKQAHIYMSSNVDPLQMIWVEFEGVQNQDILTMLHAMQEPVINISSSATRAGEAFEELVKYIASQEIVNPYQISKKLYGLICDVLEFSMFYAKESKVYPQWLQKAIEYMNEHVCERVSVKEVGTMVGYSTEHFSRSFSKHMGVSVGQYMMLCKIEQSIQLMKDRELTIGEIAEKLSFSDATHFVKSFKNILGITPSKYRKFFTV